MSIITVLWRIPQNFHFVLSHMLFVVMITLLKAYPQILRAKGDLKVMTDLSARSDSARESSAQASSPTSFSLRLAKYIAEQVIML